MFARAQAFARSRAGASFARSVASANQARDVGAAQAFARSVASASAFPGDNQTGSTRAIMRHQCALAVSRDHAAVFNRECVHEASCGVAF